MNKKQLASLALKFLNRTPISGADAEAMFLVKQWIHGIQKTAEAVEDAQRRAAAAPPAEPEGSHTDEETPTAASP
jgi:hypothetical protein